MKSKKYRYKNHRLRALRATFSIFGFARKPIIRRPGDGAFTFVTA
jgi:hypothetical protein